MEPVESEYTKEKSSPPLKTLKILQSNTLHTAKVQNQIGKNIAIRRDAQVLSPKGFIRSHITGSRPAS